MKFLEEHQNLDSLINEMALEERLEYESYGHNRLESAFVERKFVIYQCLGRHTSKNVQRPPRILTTIRVVDFSASPRGGCEVKLLEEIKQETLCVSHVPKRVFSYPLFIQIPPRVTLKYDGQWIAGDLVRSLLFAVLVKARNKAEFFSKDNIYMETPNKMRALFPHLELKFAGEAVEEGVTSPRGEAD